MKARMAFHATIILILIGSAMATAFTGTVTDFLPRRILIGPQFGFTGSRFIASNDYGALIKPTPAEERTRVAPSYGALLSARWNHGISLTLAPRRETYGVETREQTVAFPDNPFPHTLKSSTELTYNVWPLLLGMGWFTPRQHFQVQLGTYVAYLDESKIQWTVDGEPYDSTPSAQFQKTQSGWLLGTEYGFRTGRGEFLLGIESQREFHSLMNGLNGSIKVESARIHLAYMFTLMQR